MPFTREAVEELSARRSEPTWLRDARLRAWQAFESLPMPDSHRDEDWRRTDISHLNLDAFSANAASGMELCQLGSGERGQAVEELAPPSALATADKRSALAIEPASAGLPPGVIFTSLEQAACDCPDLVRAHLDVPESKLQCLNAALWTGGAFVYVPPDTMVEAPLSAIYRERDGRERDGREQDGQPRGGSQAALFPCTLIVIERGSSLVFVDHFSNGLGGDGQEPAELLSSASTRIVVGEGARLQYVSLQERGRRTWHFSRQCAVVERDGHADVVIAALGSRLSKSYVDTILAGPGAEASIVGLVLTGGEQHVDHQTLQEHRAPHTTSNLLLKSAVKDRSQSIFAGLVRMPAQAQHSDAFQEARALLLSEHAKADAIPKLEIVADDVRCTHAGAIGQVDEEQSFYLQTRGIPKEEAERLIVAGFFEPALERIPLKSVREGTRQALGRRLDGIDG